MDLENSTTMNTVSYNVTNRSLTLKGIKDMRAYLSNLSAEKGRLYLPIIVYLGILMITGIIGNSLVLYVYWYRFKRTSSSYFIISLAILDLVSCLVGIPTEIYDLRFQYNFYNSVFCKLLRFAETFTLSGSAFILVAVTIDRYFKICKPLKLIPLRNIKAMCLLATIIALPISLPTIVLFGIKRAETPEPNVFGFDCSLEEKYRDSYFQKSFFSLLIFIFIVAIIVMAALYLRIWMEIRKRRHLVIGDRVSKRPSSSSSEDKKPSNELPQTRRLRSSTSDNDDVFDNETTFRSLTRRRMSSVATVIKKMKVSRTTVLLFSVTAAFVISFLPSLLTMILYPVLKKTAENSHTMDLVAKFLSKFSFLNNSINPIIYSFLNVNFRKESATAFRKLCCRGGRTVVVRKTSVETEEEKRVERSD